MIEEFKIARGEVKCFFEGRKFFMEAKRLIPH